MQATAGSQRLELLVHNLGTIGYHCKELPVPKDWNSLFLAWKLWVTIARKCRVLFCLLVRYTTLCVAIGPVHDALFCLSVRYRLLCFVEWSGIGRFVLLIGPVQDALFLVIGPVHDACFAYWSGTERFLLLNGPVQNFFFG